MVQYRLTKLAQNDLENIWLYTIDRHSLDQANRYLDGLLASFDAIVENPGKGKSIDSVRSGYRKLPYGKHSIFFRLAADSVIEIIRVLHQRMDTETRL